MKRYILLLAAITLILFYPTACLSETDCEKVCQERDPRFHEVKDPDEWNWTHPINSKTNYRFNFPGDGWDRCICECELGYSTGYKKFPCGLSPGYTEPGEPVGKIPESALPCEVICHRGECSINAVNILDVASCPSERRLGRNCCCLEGYFANMTVNPSNFYCQKQGVKKPTPTVPQINLPGLGQGQATDEPDPSSCLDYGVDPWDFDLEYDERTLKKEFVEAMKDYGKNRRLLSGSGKFKGTIFRVDSSLFLHLGFTDDNRFLTGNEKKLAVKVNERALREGRKLTPSEVLEESLDLNNGYVYDALLTSHNLLRTDAGKRRDEVKYVKQLAKAEEQVRNAASADERKIAEENLKKVKENLKKSANIYKDLETIRESDNPGAWYHLYGTLTAGYAYPNLGKAAIFFEHRIYKNNLDKLEYCWDYWGTRLGAEIAGMDEIIDYAGVNEGMRNAYLTSRTNAVADGYGGRVLYE